MKRIQFTSGCPNGCGFCYEPKEMKYFEPEMPEREGLVQILDMNFLANPNYERHIIDCMESTNKKFELVCGVDYRRLNQDTCNMLHNARYIKIRWAWDFEFSQQRLHRNVVRMLRKAGYRPENMMCFMIINWKVPYHVCKQKLDLLKVWNVKVGDCCYDGGYKLAQPKDWTPEAIKKFRKECRKHNQLINFKIDPEYK